MDKSTTKEVIQELVKGDKSETAIAIQTGTSQSAVNRVKKKNKEAIALAGEKIIDKSLSKVIDSKIAIIEDGKTVYDQLLAEIMLDGSITEKLAFMKQVQTTEDNMLKATGIFQGSAPAVVFNQVNNDNSSKTVISPEVLSLVGNYMDDSNIVDAEVVDGEQG